MAAEVTSRLLDVMSLVPRLVESESRKAALARPRKRADWVGTVVLPFWCNRRALSDVDYHRWMVFGLSHLSEMNDVAYRLSTVGKDGAEGDRNIRRDIKRTDNCAVLSNDETLIL